MKSFVTPRLELDMLSEISQIEKDECYDITYMWNLKKKKKQRTKNNKTKLIDTANTVVASVTEQGAGEMNRAGVKRFKLLGI